MNDYEGYDINEKNQIVYVYKGNEFLTDKKIDSFPDELFDLASRKLLMVISGLSELPEVKPIDSASKIKGIGYKGWLTF